MAASVTRRRPARSTSSGSRRAPASAPSLSGDAGGSNDRAGRAMIPSFEEFEPLLSAEQIAARVRELGREIGRDLVPASDIVVVGVLKGSLVFMADLIRTLPPEVTCDFLRVSSYEGTESTGTVRF